MLLIYQRKLLKSVTEMKGVNVGHYLSPISSGTAIVRKMEFSLLLHHYLVCCTIAQSLKIEQQSINLACLFHTDLSWTGDHRQSHVV